MKNYAVSSIIFLVILAATPAFAGTASGITAQTAPVSIPSGLITYVDGIANNATASHCAAGTISPFTVKSVPCYVPEGITPQTMVTDCSTNCKNGGYTQYSSGYYGYYAFTTSPNNPTVSPAYYGSSTYSDWIGIQNCICSSAALLQAGELWGANSSYPSSSPVLFTEYYNSTDGCSTFTSNCGTLGPAVSSGDGVSMEVLYSSGQWLLYAANTASNDYTEFYVSVGSGTYDFSYGAGTNSQYGLMLGEGQGLGTATNLYPAGMNMFDVVGYTSSYTFYLGTYTAVNNPSTGSDSVTIPWTTGTCSWNSNTCGDQDIVVS